VAISAVQATDGSVANSATVVDQAFGSNVTSGNLVVVMVWRWAQAVQENLVAGDCTLQAGTATLGTIALDIQRQHAEGVNDYNIGIWSAIVTGTGSLTMRVTGNSGDFWGIGLIELSSDAGGWDSSRLEDSNSGSATVDDTDPAVSGTGTSAGDAAFCGTVLVDNLEAGTITPQAAFTEIFESEDEINDQTGSSLYRIVTTGTTDEAEWAVTTSDGWAAAVAVYLEAPAVGGPSLLTLLGTG